MGGTIILRKVNFADTTNLFQYVSVKYRLAYLPDIPSNYVLVDAKVPVASNGILMKPLIISDLKTNAPYVLLIENNCGGSPIKVNVSTGDVKDPVISWIGTDPQCELVKAANGSVMVNTGKQVYTKRLRLTDGVEDGTTIDNITTDGKYIPGVEDVLSCPLPVVSWVGADPFCDKQERITTEPAKQPTSGRKKAARVSSEVWGFRGAYIYQPGYPLNGAGTPLAHLTTPHLWVNGDQWTQNSDGNTHPNLVDGRMNKLGIWVENEAVPGTVWTPVDEWIGFVKKITLSADKTFYFGIACDNICRISVNGKKYIDTTGGGVAFPQWSIYPIPCRTGNNFIEVSVMNTSTGGNNNPAGFACEIYDMTAQQLIDATSEAQLVTRFDTGSMAGEYFDMGTSLGFSCKTDEPWVLSYDEESAQYVCMLLESVNNGNVLYQNRQRKFNSTLDTYKIPNAKDAGYIAGYVDKTMCPIPALRPVGHYECPTGWELVGNKCVLKQVAKPYCLNTRQHPAYASIGTRIYKTGFSNSSIGLYDGQVPATEAYPLLTDAGRWKNEPATTTGGPVNPHSVWLADCATGDPIEIGEVLTQGLVVTATLKVDNDGAARQIYVGVSGDNEFTLEVNKETIAKTDGTRNQNNFRFFHLFPVTLKEGPNEFFIIGKGDGTTQDSLAMVLYDYTAAELMNPATQISWLGTTSDLKYNVIQGGVAAYTCSAGFDLVNNNGVYSCQKVVDATFVE